MILLFLAAQAVAPESAPNPDEARFAACVALTEKDAARALEVAGTWQVEGGGVLAREAARLQDGGRRRAAGELRLELQPFWMPPFREAAFSAQRPVRLISTAPALASQQAIRRRRVPISTWP